MVKLELSVQNEILPLSSNHLCCVQYYFCLVKFALSTTIILWNYTSYASSFICDKLWELTNCHYSSVCFLPIGF